MPSLLAKELDDNKNVVIEVIDSYVKMGFNYRPASYIKLQIKEAPNKGGINSQLELVLSNNSKGIDPGVVYENEEKTIVGFNASNVRVNYQVNLVYLINNQQVIDQNFALRLSDLIKKNIPNKDVDLSGIFLADINERKLKFGYQTDSGRGCFSFQVELKRNGSIEFVPGSLEMDKLPMMGVGVKIQTPSNAKP